MKSLITDKVNLILKENKVTGEDISRVKGYLEASKLYDSLIESGLATKRGNNLLPRDKAHLSGIGFNR